MGLLGRLPASMRAITRSAEAQERSLLSRGVRPSRYKKISPATVQPSPITSRTLRTSLGRVGSVPSSRSGRHLLACSFHSSPAFSQSAWVVGISTATRGVADTLARASALRLRLSALLWLRLRLSAIWLLWLWLETGHKHRYRTWLGLGLLNANGERRPNPTPRSLV
jgi:hypothetical protein